MGTDDAILRDLSKLFDDLNIPLLEDGFDVRKTKSMLGSIFTNLDNNPFYQVGDATYKLVMEDLSPEEQVEFKNAFGRWLHDLTGGIEGKFYGEVDYDATDRRKNEIQQLVDKVAENYANEKALRRKAVREALAYHDYEMVEKEEGQFILRNKNTGEEFTPNAKTLNEKELEVIELAESIFIKSMGIDNPELQEILKRNFDKDTREYIIDGFSTAIRAEGEGIESPLLEDAITRYDKGQYEASATALFYTWRHNFETRGPGENEKLFEEVKELRLKYSKNEDFKRVYDELLEGYKGTDDYLKYKKIDSGE